MINYEPTISSFYIANKTYCESIETQLKTIKLDCTGFCNSFGYEIEASFTKSNKTYLLKFEKHQTTQNGVIIPVNAHNFAGTEISVSGINKKARLAVGKSSFMRLFIPKEIKDKIPTPYFIKSNNLLDNNFIDNLATTILKHDISKLRLNHRTLMIKIHTVTEHPLNLIADIDKIIESL